MMEIFLNIIPQHFIHTEVAIAIVIILDNKMDFTGVA